MRRFRNLLQSSDIFGALSEEDRELLIRKATAISFRKGSFIFRQGVKGEAFYFVASGKLYVFVDKRGAQVHIAEVLPGEFIGEMTLYQDWGRWATVTAHEDTVLFMLQKVDIRLVLDRCPAARAALEHLIIRRVENEMYFIGDPAPEPG